MIQHRRSLYKGTSDFLWICMAAEVYSPKPRTVSAGSYSSNLADTFCPPFAEEQFLVCDSILKLDQNFKGPLPGNFCFLRTGRFIVEAALNWELLPIIFLLHWNTQRGWMARNFSTVWRHPGCPPTCSRASSRGIAGSHIQQSWMNAEEGDLIFLSVITLIMIKRIFRLLATSLPLPTGSKGNELL